MLRVAIASIFVLSACGKTPEPPPPAEPTPAAPAPEVSIVSPADGDTTGSRIVIRLAAAGVRVVPASGQKVAGEGHHHVFVDVDPSAPDSIIRQGKGIFHLGSGVDSLVVDSLAPGSHRLIAVFASGDHVPMTGVKGDTARIVVR